MSKKILVIPDVHGRSFWKEPAYRYIDRVDKVIFLGDYLDPYLDKFEEYQPQYVYDNFLEIIDFAQSNRDKVILLKGNHDQHFASELFRDLACGSRCDTINWDAFHKLFSNYKGLFKLAHLEKVNGITFIFSHAGLTVSWINKVNASIWKMPDNRISVGNASMIKRINALDDTQLGQKNTCHYWKVSKTVIKRDVQQHPLGRYL